MVFESPSFFRVAASLCVALATLSDGPPLELCIENRRRLERVLKDRDFRSRHLSATPVADEPDVKELLERLRPD